MDYILEGIGNEVLTAIITNVIIIVILLIKYLKYGSIIRFVLGIWQYLRHLCVNGNTSNSILDHEHESDNNFDLALRGRVFNSDCCVCLAENCNYPVTSGCGHCFCGICAMNLIDHNSVPMKCPLCRQECHVLFLPFRESQNNYNEDELRDMVVNSVTSYNTRAENRFPFVNRVRNVPVILRHLVRSFISFRGHLIFRLKCHVVVAVLVAVSYVALSTDIIPERVFGLIGFIDDFMVVTFLTVLVARTYTGIDSSITLEDIRAAVE